MLKNLEYYLNGPWSYSISQDHDKEGTFYIIRVAEWPGVVSDAPTIETARDHMREALSLAIRMSLEAGDHIPVPFRAR